MKKLAALAGFPGRRRSSVGFLSRFAIATGPVLMLPSSLVFPATPGTRFARVTPPEDVHVVERSRYCMGTIATVSIEEMEPALPDGAPALAAEAALDRLDEVDAAASLYKQESDLARLNRTAWPGPAPASGVIADLLRLSLDVARRTGGAFDPTVKPLLDELGFYREIGSVQDPSGMKGAMARVGWKRVDYDARAGEVRYARKGMALDFGGIGKGYALDLAAGELRARGVSRARLEIGRSSFVLMGRDPAYPDGRFRLAITLPDPAGDEPIAAVVAVPEGSVATSAPYAQVRHEGQRVASHIVDPKRGLLETSVCAATVWAREGAVADALATALVVAGPRGLTRFARRFRFEALLLVEKRTGGQRALATPGLVWLPAPADPARDQGVGRPRR